MELNLAILGTTETKTQTWRTEDERNGFPASWTIKCAVSCREPAFSGSHYNQRSLLAEIRFKILNIINLFLKSSRHYRGGIYAGRLEETYLFAVKKMDYKVGFEDILYQ